MNVKDLIRTSIISAIIFVCLMVLNIKTATDLISFAYVVVFASAIIFGGKIAGLGCGIGAMLFDMFSGYINYAPFTLLAYGVMAFFIGYFLHNHKYTSKSVELYVIAIVATIINIFFYFLANYIYYGLPFAIASIPIEVINCLIGIVIGIPLGNFLKKIIPHNA